MEAFCSFQQIHVLFEITPSLTYAYGHPFLPFKVSTLSERAHPILRIPADNTPSPLHFQLPSFKAFGHLVT